MASRMTTRLLRIALPEKLAVSLPTAVQAAVGRAMSSHSAAATLLLGKDRQAMPLPEGVIWHKGRKSKHRPSRTGA